jgi:hypothetical protein
MNLKDIVATALGVAAVFIGFRIGQGLTARMGA